MVLIWQKSTIKSHNRRHATFFPYRSKTTLIVVVNEKKIFVKLLFSNKFIQIQQHTHRTIFFFLELKKKELKNTPAGHFHCCEKNCAITCVMRKILHSPMIYHYVVKMIKAIYFYLFKIGTYLPIVLAFLSTNLYLSSLSLS